MVWKETMMHEVVRFRRTDDGKIIRVEEEKSNCTFNSRLLERDFNDSGQIFIYLYQHFNSKFPKHFIFANFQCLRCGECCNDQREVSREDVERWMTDLRYYILKHVDCFEKGWCINYCDLVEPCEDCDNTIKEIVTDSHSGRCPFVRKVRDKPYYECRINDNYPDGCRGWSL